MFLTCSGDAKLRRWTRIVLNVSDRREVIAESRETGLAALGDVRLGITNGSGASRGLADSIRLAARGLQSTALPLSAPDATTLHRSDRSGHRPASALLLRSVLRPCPQVRATRQATSGATGPLARCNQTLWVSGSRPSSGTRRTGVSRCNRAKTGTKGQRFLRWSSDRNQSTRNGESHTHSPRRSPHHPRLGTLAVQPWAARI